MSFGRSRSDGSSAATIRTDSAPTFEIGPWNAACPVAPGSPGSASAASASPRQNAAVATVASPSSARAAATAAASPRSAASTETSAAASSRASSSRAPIGSSAIRVAERAQRSVLVPDAHRPHTDRQHQRRRGGASPRAAQRPAWRRSPPPAPSGSSSSGKIEPVIRQPRIAVTACLAERDRRLPRNTGRRQLRAEHMQEAQAGGPDPIDPLLRHLDHRPLAVAVRLFRVERVAASRPIDDRPEPRRPGRQPRRPPRARHSRHGLIHGQKPRFRGRAGRRRAPPAAPPAQAAATPHHGLEPPEPIGRGAMKQDCVRKGRDHPLDFADQRASWLLHVGRFRPPPPHNQARRRGTRCVVLPRRSPAPPSPKWQPKARPGGRKRRSKSPSGARQTGDGRLAREPDESQTRATRGPEEARKRPGRGPEEARQRPGRQPEEGQKTARKGRCPELRAGGL